MIFVEFNNITGIEYYDCLNAMDIITYFKVFFQTATDEEIKDLIEKSNNIICQQSMEKFIVPELNKLYYQNEKYYEQAEMIISYAQTLYKILKELKKADNENIDYSLIEKLESNHIRTNLKYDGVTIHIRSLKEYIDENFKLYATWSHNMLILDKVKNEDERLWYMQKCVENGWSFDVLQIQIDTNLYERQGKL